MALQTTTKKPPKGAIILSSGEAISYQWDQIFDWPNKLEVWSFSWGLAGLGMLAGASSTYINLRYRTKLKLRHFGHFSTSLPMIVAPILFSTGLHIQIVTNDLMLRETKCPLCLQYRAAAIQLAFGIGYPIVLAPIANFTFAMRHATYRLPHWKDYKGTFKLWLQFTRPLGTRLIFMGFVHILAAGFVTYSEAEHLHKIQSTLLRLQEEHAMEN